MVHLCSEISKHSMKKLRFLLFFPALFSFQCLKAQNHIWQASLAEKGVASSFVNHRNLDPCAFTSQTSQYTAGGLSSQIGGSIIFSKLLDDIFIPAETCRLINSLTAYFWLVPGGTINDVNVYLYNDSLNFPGSLANFGGQEFNSIAFESTYLLNNGAYDVYAIKANFPSPFEVCAGASAERIFIGMQVVSNVNAYWDYRSDSTLVGSDALIFSPNLGVNSYAAVSPNASLTFNYEFIEKTEIAVELCEGDTLFIGGLPVTEAGFYNDTLTSSSGCDSLLVSAVTMKPAPTVSAGTGFSVCAYGEVVPLNGSPVGGTWTGVGVNGTDFEPADAPLGNNELTYSFTAANGCQAEASIMANVSECLNVNENSGDGIFSVFPNPGTTNITVNLGEFSLPASLNVLDIAGKVVHTGTINQTLHNLDISDLAEGVYFLRVNQGSAAKSLRFVKVK